MNKTFINRASIYRDARCSSFPASRCALRRRGRGELRGRAPRDGARGRRRHRAGDQPAGTLARDRRRCGRRRRRLRGHRGGLGRAGDDRGRAGRRRRLRRGRRAGAGSLPAEQPDTTTPAESEAAQNNPDGASTKASAPDTTADSADTAPDSSVSTESDDEARPAAPVAAPPKAAPTPAAINLNVSVRIGSAGTTAPWRSSTQPRGQAMKAVRPRLRPCRRPHRPPPPRRRPPRAHPSGTGTGTARIFPRARWYHRQVHDRICSDFVDVDLELRR